MIMKIPSRRSIAAAAIGGAFILGTATFALASESSSAVGSSRAEALRKAYYYAEGGCSAINKTPSYSSKDCSEIDKNRYQRWECVVTYDCR